MAKIDVYSGEMSELSARLKRIAGVIGDAEQITGKVQRNLDFQVAAKQGIASGLRSAKVKLQRQSDKVKNLSTLTTVSDEEFRWADGQMDKKARNIIGRILSPATGIIRDLKSFFVGISVSKYQKISSLFMPAGTIITVAGLQALIRRLREIISGKNTGGGGNTGSGNTGGAQSVTTPPPAEPVRKPAAVNTGSSKQNAENAGLTYYTQGKGYNKYWNENVWKGSDGKSYADKLRSVGKDKNGNNILKPTRSLACGICCEAMIASYFGAQLTPGQLLQANGGSASWDGSGVTKLMKQNGITSNRAVAKTASPQEKISALDDAIENHRNNPGSCAPPMVSIYSKGSGSNHFVMVVGKDEKGDYIIVDPANNERTTLKALTTGYGKGNKTGYESVIKGVWTWTKK